MKRKIGLFLIASALGVATIGGLGFVVTRDGSVNSLRAQASVTKSITWDKNTGATATTSGGNDITLGSRYFGEWTFGGDYFAVSSGTNTFLDNFTNKSCPIRDIRSITVTYTYDTNPLAITAFRTEGYGQGGRAYVESAVSGKKYEIGSGDLDYVNCNSDDTFTAFYLQNKEGKVEVSSLVVEYICD